MTNSKRRSNLAFGTVVGLLAAVAATSMVFNWNRPVIREAAAPAMPSNPDLPPNHPPIDSAGMLSTLEEMSRKNPENADYKTRIGDIYFDLGQYQSALEAYQESLNLRPEDPNAETKLATCYHYLGQHDTALQLLDKVLQYRPGFPQALVTKGIVLIEGKKDKDGGIAVWKELLRSTPDFPQKADLEQMIRQIQSRAN